MGKTALVISGGGSKGAFATGVIQQMAVEYPDVVFDILVGTSTGALIAPMVAVDELDLLQQLYTSVHNEDIYLEGNAGFRLMNNASLYDVKPLANLIKQYYTDARCNSILQSSKEVYIATTSLQTEQAVYFSTKDPAIISDYKLVKLKNPDELRRAVMASACQPVLMSPIEINPGATPTRQYVDGGVREYAGLQLAIDAGAEDIYVILLSSGEENVINTTYTSALDVLKRTIDIFITDVGSSDLRGPRIYNRALRYIRAVKQQMQDDGIAQPDIEKYFNVPLNPFTGKKPLNIHVIRPTSPLDGGPGGMIFDPAKMSHMLALGKLALSDYMASLPPDGSGNV